MMKLATKLLFLFLLLAILPLAVVGYLAYDNGRRTIEQNVLNHLISTNILKQSEFDRWVHGSERGLRELAQRPLVREYAATLASQDPTDPEYQAAWASLAQDHLNPFLEEGSGYLALSILRAEDGLILISTDKSLEGKYRESEPFFVEGKNRTYVENVTYSLTHGGLVMHISTPIRDREGNLVAVLAGHADLAEMSAIMEQRSGLSQTEDTYLVNTFNFFVTEPRFGAGYALKKAVHTEGVHACLEHNDSVSFYADYRGVPVIGAYRWMPERELCILTEVAQSEAFAPIIALRNTVLGIGVAAALVAALLGFIFARTITRPVRQLVEGAEQIGRGNLETRIEVETRDEIGQLSQAFNQMTENLQAITASRDELDREITERKRAEETLKQTLRELQDSRAAALNMMLDADEARKMAEQANEELRREIAERVRAEEELKQYQDQLEGLVEERTSELRETQERLIRQEKLAVLGQLAGGVGHELRNPLGAIKNAAYYLNMVLEDPDLETREILEVLEKEVDTSEKIISSLLDFARARPPIRRKVDLNAVVQEALSRTALPDAPHVELVLELDEDLPPILADPDQLFQVLGNLVRNGIQAMTGGGRLVVRTAVEGPEWVTVSVADSGAGISEENLKKIFEPLFTTKAKGIGLGLAVVRTLVEGHGGTIGVESQVGQGSTFTVRLPLGVSAAVEGEGM
jgi:signal transduction histidine kinase